MKWFEWMSESPSKIILEADSDIFWYREAIPEYVIRLYLRDVRRALASAPEN
jgi:hypothetical protein